MTVRRPQLLRAQDTIGVAASAGPLSKSGRKKFLKGVSLLKKSGLRVTYRKNIFARERFLAGSDQRRLQELNYYFSDSKTKALLFSRGGYGSQRIAPFLKRSCRPKVVVGSSDLTVVLIHLWQKCGLPTFYGPMVAPHLTSVQSVRNLVRSLTKLRFIENQKIKANKILKKGRAEGTLVGGCLSLIVSTLGTPHELNTDNTLLFLEDTNEEPYAVDRMLIQLEQAGKFRKVRGIIFGTFKQGKTLFPKSIEDVARERLKFFKGPVLWGVRFGHCQNGWVLPFGGKGKVQGNRLMITRGIF